MKKTIACISIIMSLFFAFLAMTACVEPEIINEYEYSDSSFHYSEMYDDFTQNYTANKTTTDTATYFFDQNISTNNRNRFVTYSEQILAHLGYDNTNDSYENSLVQIDEEGDKSLKFYISNDFKQFRADYSDTSVFMSPAYTKKIEHVICIFQALNSDTLNYGLTYGLANRTCIQLGYGGIVGIDKSSTKSFLNKQENRYILDLNYPVFHTKYSSNQQIKFAESISVSLVDYIKETHGGDAFDQLIEADWSFDLSFDTLFYGYLNEWLTDMNVQSVEINSEVLKWSPYSSNYPIRVLSNSCEYFIKDDFNEEILADFYEYRNTQFGYKFIKEQLIKAEKSYIDVREFFDYSATNRYPTQLANLGTLGGMLTQDKRFNIVSSACYLTLQYAEYINYLKHGEHESWMKYAVTHYVRNAFTDYLPNDTFYAYTETEEYNKDSVLTEWHLAAFEYLELSSHDNYFLSFINAYNFIIFNEGVEDLQAVFYTYINSQYILISLSDFLIETYGKDKFFELYQNLGEFLSVYDKTETQILDEYLDYLQNFFTWE